LPGNDLPTVLATLQAGASTRGSALLTQGTYLPAAVWGALSYAVVTGARADAVSQGSFSAGLAGSSASGGPGSSAVIPSAGAVGGAASTGSGAASDLSTSAWVGVVVAVFVVGAVAAFALACLILRRSTSSVPCLSSKPLQTGSQGTPTNRAETVMVRSNPLGTLHGDKHRGAFALVRSAG
jgi:hypothetical protein